MERRGWEYTSELWRRISIKILGNRKPFGWKGLLNYRAIHKLIRYYKNAIRTYENSRNDMTDIIWATYYHYTSLEQDT